jgi:hypothetical protein
MSDPEGDAINRGGGSPGPEGPRTSDRPDELLTLGKRRASEPAPRPAPELPLTVMLPTRYYGRMALSETAREFAELAEVQLKVVDGAIALTIVKLDGEAGDPATIVDELLNHALLASIDEVAK